MHLKNKLKKEQKKKQLQKKQEIKQNFYNSFEFLKFQFFHVTPSNSVCLVTKTASSGPEVSVPTLGSWKYDDLTCKMTKKS